MRIWVGILLMALSPAALATPPQKPFADCVSDPAPYLALDLKDFDQGISAPQDGGPRKVWGWREISEKPGCETAAADLIAMWVKRNGRMEPRDRIWMRFHEGQVRASGGDFVGGARLIEAGRGAWPSLEGAAYVDAILAFLRNDRPALMAARERMLAVPEPPNWAHTQQLFREQAGQEMRWPLNIESVDTLVRCFGHSYPGGVSEVCD